MVITPNNARHCHVDTACGYIPSSLSPRHVRVPAYDEKLILKPRLNGK